MTTPTATQRLFPLPLTPLELAILADDTEAYPMSCILGAELQGSLHGEVLEAALDDALARHPLLNASIERVGRHRQAWIACGPRPSVQWHAAGQPIAASRGRLDLMNGPGLRVHAVSTDDKSRLYLHLHHACTDGIGAQRFLGDLLACYGRRIDRRRPPELSPVDIAGLLLRRPRWESSSGREIAIRWWDFLKESAAFLGTRSAIFDTASNLSEGSDDPVVPFPGSLSMDFTTEVTTGLRLSAARSQATLHDLLITALLRTLDNLDQQHRNKAYRIAVATNLRTPDQQSRLSATCLMEFVMLHAKRSSIHSNQHLMETISERLRYQIDRRYGLFLAHQKAVLVQVPGLLPLIFSKTNRLATAVMSYLGDPSRHFLASFPRLRGKCLAGNVTLERLTSATALRPGTTLNVAANTYGGRLNLNVTLKSTLPAAKLFCSQYLGQIREFLDPVDRSSAQSDFSSVRN